MYRVYQFFCIFNPDYCPQNELLIDFGGSNGGTWDIVNDDVMGGVSTGEWMIVNDDVMGGNSQGSAETTNNNVLLFEGSLSLENNGGFSSVKTDGNWNLENFQVRKNA